MDEKEKIKEVVREREEKIELLNRSFDEKDKLIQDLESRFVLIALRLLSIVFVLLLYCLDDFSQFAFELKYQKVIHILCDKF